MKNKRDDLVYPELSYKIIGCLFSVFRKIGANHRERYYQTAVKCELNNQNIPYNEQVHTPINYDGQKIGRVYFDFLIEDKVILEIKCCPHFSNQNIKQVYDYLTISGLKLGIIANFTRDGVKSYRVVNIK